MIFINKPGIAIRLQNWTENKTHQRLIIVLKGYHFMFVKKKYWTTENFFGHWIKSSEFTIKSKHDYL